MRDGDPYADLVAREAAVDLSLGTLGRGHTRAVEAHVRALVAGYGAERTADLLWGMVAVYLDPETLADAAEDARTDQLAWERLTVRRFHSRGRTFIREIVETAVAKK